MKAIAKQTIFITHYQGSRQLEETQKIEAGEEFVIYGGRFRTEIEAAQCASDSLAVATYDAIGKLPEGGQPALKAARDRQDQRLRWLLAEGDSPYPEGAALYRRPKRAAKAP